MKKHMATLLLILIFFIGLSLLLYPSFSDWWNSFHSSQAITNYSEIVANIDDDKYAEIWNAAWNYNQSLVGSGNAFEVTDEQRLSYEQLLDVGGNGIMGYIEIPMIDVSLPIYHGTDESVLQIAVGHLEWSSLPVGGESTHCVISGHRGLPSAKLFTNLDKLVLGDIFILRTLDEILTYEVDQVLIVEPHEVDALRVVAGKDLCTLVTCTPYGINTHRMLVRGHRVENLEDARQIRVTADATQIDPVIVAPLVVAPMLLILLIGLLLPKKNRREKG